MDALSIAAQPGEPLAAWFSPLRGGAALRGSAGVREQRFECASRGDLVSGRCWWPAETAGALVIAVHDLARAKDDPALAAAAAAWAAARAATAAIDLPLHGERHNAKLTPRAIAGARSGREADFALWRALLEQAVRDLARALDALATRGALPPVACVAFGDSAPIAQAFASLDSRVTHAAAIGDARPSAPDLRSATAKPLVWLARPGDLTLAR